MKHVRSWLALGGVAVVALWLLCLWLAMCCPKKGDNNRQWVVPRYDRNGVEVLQWPFQTAFNASLSWNDCAFFMCSKSPECVEEAWLRERVYTNSLADLTQEIARRGSGFECCHSLLFLLLRAWKDIAQELEIDYLVSFGTLLGGVRTGALIPWTGDIDIAVNTSSLDYLLTNQVREKLWSQGWHVFDQACGRMCIPRGGLLAKALVPDYDPLRPSHRWQAPYVDFYASFNRSEYGENCTTMSTCHYPTSYLFPPSTVLIHNHSFPAPAKTLEVLRLDYGPFYNDTSGTREAHGTTCDHGGLMVGQNPCFQYRGLPIQGDWDDAFG